jgi:hypothetical protein
MTQIPDVALYVPRLAVASRKVRPAGIESAMWSAVAGKGPAFVAVTSSSTVSPTVRLVGLAPNRTPTSACFGRGSTVMPTAATLFELLVSNSSRMPVKYARLASMLETVVVTLAVSVRLSVSPIFRVSRLHLRVAWS